MTNIASLRHKIKEKLTKNFYIKLVDHDGRLSMYADVDKYVNLFWPAIVSLEKYKYTSAEDNKSTTKYSDAAETLAKIEEAIDLL